MEAKGSSPTGWSVTKIGLRRAGQDQGWLQIERQGNQVALAPGTSDPSRLRHRWIQTGRSSHLEEVRREQKAVYLHDPLRKTEVVIDLEALKVSEQDGETYRIRHAEAETLRWVDPGGPSYKKVPCQGQTRDALLEGFPKWVTTETKYVYRRTVDVDTQKASWSELSPQGQVARTFDEVRCDEGSVYLRNEALDLSVQIDLAKDQMVFDDLRYGLRMQRAIRLAETQLNRDAAGVAVYAYSEKK